MPKIYNRRTRKLPSYRGRSRRRSGFIQFGILIIVVGLLVSWWLSRTPSLAFQAPFQSAGAYELPGQPTISADFINQVLDHYRSPAAGKGQALYDYGVKYGIDPAYALAFFMQESSFGTTGVARVTLSLGNIRASDGYQQYHGYRKYHSWEEGFEDWYKLIAQQYVQQWNLTTVDEIIPIYAPSSDHNDVTAYIQAVKTAVDTWRNGYIQV